MTAYTNELQKVYELGLERGKLAAGGGNRPGEDGPYRPPNPNEAPPYPPPKKVAHQIHTDNPQWSGEHDPLKDHVQYDPSGSPIMYDNVPLFNKDGKPLPTTRDNDGMKRKEYWERSGQPWVPLGFPPGEEGKKQYQKVIEQNPGLADQLTISDAQGLTDTLSPFQNPRSGSLRDSGLSNEEKKKLLIRGVEAYKA